jgi:cell division protein FtsL
MAAVAPHARASAPTFPEVRATPRPRPERRPRVANGVLWILVIGLLLAGVVFMNVAVLRLNMKLDRLGRDRAQLQADTAALASDLSSAQAAARIQAQAHGLGLVPARASDTVYVNLRP